VDGGPWSGRTLAEVAAEWGARLLGDPVVERTSLRFPLLIKLLDSRQWLSVQVHPNNEQAERLEGPGHFGKTEAWHVLEADAGARVISGVSGDPSTERLRQLARDGAFEEALAYIDVKAGDTLFTPAGRMHAIGPGLFIYEVQQTSDITYRLFDWNRPATDGRELHLDKGLTVIAASDEAHVVRSASYRDGDRHALIACEYFALDLVSARDQPVLLSTGGTSFHAVTVKEGAAEIVHDGGVAPLRALQSVVVPAAVGDYAISPQPSCKALVAYVP
jgi:mannose-6-phosphate isomerase